MPIVEEFTVNQSLEFTRQEYEQRQRRLVEATDDAVDVVLVSSPVALRYFSGYRTLLTESSWRPLVLGIPSSGATPFLCVPEQDEGCARATTWVELRITQESVRNGREDPIVVLADELRSRGYEAARIGMEFGFGQRMGMTVDELDALRATLPKAEFVDVSAALWQTRSIKSAAEIDFLRRACEISCEGVRAGFDVMQAGMTEREVHRIMIEAMVRAGADQVHLTFGSGATGYGAFNCYPTDLILEPGHLVWVDGGAVFNGYVCDFIRTAIVAEPSADQERWYEASLVANRAAVAAVRPGVTCGEVFDAARGEIEKAGLMDAWGLDVLGHGVGLEIHELPSITENSEQTLEPGHVITIEPALSPPRHEHGHYIVEEVLAITEDGFENLTESLSPDLWITDK